MAESKPLSWQFDDAAQLYDEVRPRYPEEIIERIIAFAALPAQAHVFEVGCGTGHMTLPFAQRGYTVIALDQGERLAALATKPGRGPCSWCWTTRCRKPRSRLPKSNWS